MEICEKCGIPGHKNVHVFVLQEMTSQR